MFSTLKVELLILESFNTSILYSNFIEIRNLFPLYPNAFEANNFKNPLIYRQVTENCINKPFNAL